MRREELVEVLMHADSETLSLQAGTPIEVELGEGSQLTVLLQSGERAFSELGPAYRLRLFEHSLELSLEEAHYAISYEVIVGLKISARGKNRAGFRR